MAVNFVNGFVGVLASGNASLIRDQDQQVSMALQLRKRVIDRRQYVKFLQGPV